MKGGKHILSKEQCRNFLRIAKDFIKINSYCKDYNLSQSAISRFINYDEFDMVGDVTLNIICDEIYNSAILIKDIYEENQKIA